MRVAAIGRTGVLYESIKQLDEAGHEIVLVVTCDGAPEYDRTVGDFEALADDLGIPCLTTTDINADSVVDRIRATDPDVAVSVNWKTLIGATVRSQFEYGILNCHAGDLPRYRGNAAPNWAMLQGEDEVVVTVHAMDAGLDSGPILVQRSLPIDRDTYISDVYEFSRRNAPAMFLEAIEGLKSGSLSPTEQSTDPEDALRCYPRLPRDSFIDWNQSADRLERLVRASAEPLPGAYTYLGRDRLTIWRASVETAETPHLGTPGQVARRDPANGTVAIVTGEDLLLLETVQLEGGERQPATSVLTSHRDRLGMVPQDEIHQLSDEVEQLREQVQSLEERD